MTRKGILVSVALLLVTAGKLNANDELAITELYGQAVHAYFDGAYEESHQFLTDAIKLGTDDPRIYYYRGLAKMKLGRDAEAQEDFEAGGKLEAAGPAQFYPIGRSLERIQGESRVAIEKVRKEARIAIRLRKKQIEDARLEAFRRDERLRNSGAAVQLGNPSAESQSEEDPFGTAGAGTDNNTAPATSPETTPAADLPKPSGDDPFSAPKKPAEPAGDDPFSAPKKPAEPAGDDPFANPGKAGDAAKEAPAKGDDSQSDDPFGDPGKSGDSAKEAPAKEGDSQSDDPFADPDDKSDAKKNDTKPGGGASDDPFK